MPMTTSWTIHPWEGLTLTPFSRLVQDTVTSAMVMLYTGYSALGTHRCDCMQYRTTCGPTILQPSCNTVTGKAQRKYAEGTLASGRLSSSLSSEEGPLVCPPSPPASPGKWQFCFHFQLWIFCTIIVDFLTSVKAANAMAMVKEFQLAYRCPLDNSLQSNQIMFIRR